MMTPEQKELRNRFFTAWVNAGRPEFTDTFYHRLSYSMLYDYASWTYDYPVWEHHTGLEFSDGVTTYSLLTIRNGSQVTEVTYETIVTLLTMPDIYTCDTETQQIRKGRRNGSQCVLKNLCN